MARALKKAKEDAPPPVGHNSGPLTDEQREALGVHHQIKITEAQRKLDALLVDVAAARKTVNGAFKRMTADLTYTRQDFQREVLDKLNMTPAEYAAHIKTVDQLHRIAGLRQGEQIDLVEHILKDTVDESEAAFQDGYRAGRRADDPVPPKHVAGIMQPKWMEGWHAGQAYNGMQLGKAAEIIAAREGPPPTVGEQAAADFAEDNPEVDVEAAARKLKNDPEFMDRSAPEAEHEQAAA